MKSCGWRKNPISHNSIKIHAENPGRQRLTYNKHLLSYDARHMFGGSKVVYCIGVMSNSVHFFYSANE